MKKLLFLFTLFAALSFTSKAQSTLISQYSNTVDTVDNTETIYLTVPTATTTKAYYKTAFVVFKAQEISGTGGGTATLEASANGTDFATVPGQSAYTIVDQTAAQTSAWNIAAPGWSGKSLRIKITGAGTMSYKVYGSVIFKN